MLSLGSNLEVSTDHFKADEQIILTRWKPNERDPGVSFTFEEFRK